MLVYDSGIAQLVEHLTVNQGVVSSSLTTGVSEVLMVGSASLLLCQLSSAGRASDF